MNEQGPYSEFQYNINTPLSFLQQQQRTRPTNNITTTRNGNNSNNNNNVDMTTSPLLALPLPPPSPATDENLDNNSNRRRDNSNLASLSITRAIRNRVTTGTDALTTYRRAAGGHRSHSGGTIVPLHTSANTTSNLGGGGSHNVMTIPVSLGSDRDFVYGVIFGSMVGSCMLLWIWIPTVSYKQKLGILFGYALHITMNMINKSFNGEQYDESHSNLLSPDDVNYNNYQYSRNFLIDDDTLQLGE